MVDQNTPSIFNIVGKTIEMVEVTVDETGHGDDKIVIHTTDGEKVVISKIINGFIFG